MTPEAGAATAGSSHDRPYPTNAQVRSARRYAQRRGGLVSFAVLGAHDGLRGLDAHRQYVTGSVVKAMLLAAELRRLKREHVGLDETTRGILDSMITISDNAAANSIYYRVGDAGLEEVARLAGMKNFEVPGYWANAQITAADQVRLFARLEGNLVGPHQAFAKGLLAGITEEQRWGIFNAVGPEWKVWLKGGWRATGLGSLVHQAARLEHPGGRVALAVLTDDQPSQGYAIETIEGVSRRLLRPAPGADAGAS